MCFGCCDETTTEWQSPPQPNHGYVENRPIYDNTMGQTVITQPSYGYGGGLETSISTQPSYGGGYGGGMTEEIVTSPSRY